MTATAEHARSLVQQMHEFACSLPFEDVSDVCEWRPQDEDDDPESARFLSMLGTQYGKKTMPDGEERWIDIPPKHVLMFNISPAEGSETAAFGLAAHPPAVEYDYLEKTQVIETGMAGVYSWTQVCKTQYAGLQQHGGVENFLKAHLSLVKLLDFIATLPVTLQVSDDSGYWTHRDESQLRQQLASWNGLIAAFAGQLKDQLGTSTETGVQAPILSAPDFEHLEAKGVAEWGTPPPAERD